MRIRKAWCKKGKELLDEIKDTKVSEDELAIWFFLLHMGDKYIAEKLLYALKQMPAPHVFLTPINGADYFRDKKNIIGNMSVREAAFN